MQINRLAQPKVQHHSNCLSATRRYSFFPPSAALRIRTRDLDLWAAVALGYGLQAACCSVIFAPSGKKKKKKREHGDPRRTDQSLTGSYHSAGTYSQLQGIMGNWDIFIVSAPIVSLSVRLSRPPVFTLSLSSPIVSSFSPSPPRPPSSPLAPYLNYFPFPLLSVSLSSLLHLSLHLLLVTVIPRFLS